MIRRSIYEWGRVNIGIGPDSVPRPLSNRLIAVARTAQKQLRIGGQSGEAILSEQGQALSARQVVGVLAAPGVSLEILPKIDGLDAGATRLNLVRMLAATVGLKIFDGELAQLGLQCFDLLEILIRLFCNNLFAAVHRGLPRRYVEHADDLKVLRERLDTKRQFTTLAASPERLACRYEDLSADIPLNQILKAAVRHLRSISRSSDNLRLLMELEYAFVDVAMVSNRALPFGSVVLDRTNRDWHDLLRLAKLLLGNQFQNTSTGDNQGFSLLFEMNALFEKFVGGALQQAMRGSGLSVTLQKPQNFVLSDANDNVRSFMTKPDIVIHRGSEAVMILDTKWKQLHRLVDDPKRGVSQADVYQIIAYGQIYSVKELTLLYPHFRALGVAGIQSTAVITGTSGNRLNVATVDLSDFGTIAAQLADLYGAHQVARTA